MGQDSDGDGIPDYADICMDTPKGVRVDQVGCSTRSEVAGLNNHQKINGFDRREATFGEMENILFDFDRFEIKPQYYSVLDNLAMMLSQNPEAKVEIQGHTDNIGSAEYNRDLSEKRARTVRNYFVLKGVEKDRLLPKGYGFTASRASNEDEAGRALNRRVEFTLQN
jgi:outer membrane protein OmpA-like peptidoglycan-associated protein